MRDRGVVHRPASASAMWLVLERGRRPRHQDPAGRTGARRGVPNEVFATQVRTGEASSSTAIVGWSKPASTTCSKRNARLLVSVRREYILIPSAWAINVVERDEAFRPFWVPRVNGLSVSAPVFRYMDGAHRGVQARWEVGGDEDFTR